MVSNRLVKRPTQLERANVRLLAAVARGDRQRFEVEIEEVRAALELRCIGDAVEVERLWYSKSRALDDPVGAVVTVLRRGGELGVRVEQLAAELGLMEKTATKHAREAVRQGLAEVVAKRRWRAVTCAGEKKR